MSKSSADKKIILSIVGFVAVMAVIVGALLFLGRDKEPEQPLDDNQVNLYEPGSVIYDEDTTAVDVTLSPAMNNAVQGAANPAHSKAIEAFVIGTYYMTMIDYSSGTATEMSLALRGDSFQMSTEMNGMKLDIMMIADNVYFVNSTEKKYIDFKSIMQMAGASSDDFDISEMREVADMLKVSEYEFTGLENLEEDRNGESYVGYKFYSNDMELYFWFVGDELRQLEFASVGGEKASVDVEEFYPYIPDGMLTLIGLTRTTIFEFFGDEFMNSLE